MELKFTVQTKIQKPVAEVFDGVYNPGKLSRYFATGGASGPLAEGTKVVWQFADFPGIEAPVEVKTVVPNERIVFEWPSDEKGGGHTRVEMTFQPIDGGSTLVSISESGWSETQKGLDASYGNCQGWMNMVSCLKAFLEYGINLRQGAF